MEDVLEVIRQDDPARYEQIMATSLSEKRWGVVGDETTARPVFERESGSEAERLSWRAA
jgi:hypothetical protein